MKQIIHTSKAPKAIGPYSQAVAAPAPGAMLFLSGQIALDPASGQMVGASAAAEARQALTNLRHVVEAAGFSLADVVKTTVYLARMEDFPAVNEVYAGFFEGTPPPARATVGVAALPKGARVEVDAICVLGG
jgi:2-iminobutanoate/2-iminopropanoate deaminase